MTILDALVLGVVEGIAEFLPISSTGHLIVTGALLGIPPDEFFKSFEISIQLGAIAAVALLYWRRFLEYETIIKIATAFIPTAIIGVALYSFIKSHLLGNSAVVLWALALGGIALIVFELLHKESETEDSISTISYKQAFVIGLFQSIAIIPGVSRSAATIVGGLISGLRRKTIVEFSFLLAVPVMAAATGIDLLKSAGTFSQSDFGVLAVGFFTAFFVALAAVRFLLAYVQRYTFIAFGIYRLVAAIVFYFLLF